MATISIDLPGLPPSANSRLHYMARHKSNQEWKDSTKWVLMDVINRGHFIGLPWDRVHVRYEFHYPRRTLADLDNLVGRMKPCLDGLVGLAVTKDDSRHVHQLEATLAVSRGTPAGVRIVVDECHCVVQNDLHS